VFRYACHDKRFLPTPPNPGFQALFQVLTSQKYTILPLIPFGLLLFAAISKDRKKDSKLDARAVRFIFIGFGVVENKKCFMAYTLNSINPYKIGTVFDTVSVNWILHIFHTGKDKRGS